MRAIARVATAIALDRTFDYIVPEAMLPGAVVGMRVLIPFGRQKTTGIIVELADRSDREDLKPILSLADPHPMLDAKLLELGRWIGAYYCTPLEQVLRSMLPAPVRRTGATFKTRRAAALCPGASDRPPADWAALPAKQRLVAERLRADGPQAAQELARGLGITTAPITALARKGWITIEDETVARSPLSNRRVLPTEPLALVGDQAAALDTIRLTMDAAPPGAGEAGAGAPEVVLLHGVTGSGKTEVYLQAIAHALERGQGAIVLVPEISLTPQTIDRFVSRFGPRVAVLHSRLSDGERFDEWHRIRAGEATIVVGARSAVFAPVRPLGMIVVDEEHEPSYKQEEAPRYHARDVAVMRGRIEGCVVVLGSATPSLESWVNADKGKYRLASLPVRVDNRSMPAVRIVDMRVETQRTGHVSVFSKELLDGIQDRLSRGEQTMLFLNRRGFASTMICPMCGHTEGCDACSVTMTYHRHDERLRCHLCGASRRVPAVCPQCKDPAIRYTGFGTQRVESIVQRCFKHAAIARMDADATAAKGAHARILGDFRAGKFQILVGTQMIAKGLDFPNVTLVGVVNADLSMHLPDFRAGERTFQLLQQVAGRAGRGHVPGEVIVQTYTPHHPAMQAVRRDDFVGFCAQEAGFRKELGYPPYARLISLSFRGRVEAQVAAAADAISKGLTAAVDARIRVSPAVPAAIARIKGAYRFQVLLRGRSVMAMTGPIRQLMRDHAMPNGVTCSVDVDAVNLM